VTQPVGGNFLAAASAPGGRSSSRRSRARTRPTERLRPSDVLAGFFAPVIGFLMAAAAVAVVHTATGWAPGHWLARAARAMRAGPPRI
jgi:hypothetical protein